MTSAEIDFRE